MSAGQAEVQDLAIFTGRPAFDEPLHVGRPNVGDRSTFQELMDGVLDRNWLTNDGPLVREFEVQIAKRLAVDHCVAMCNGTVALEIAIRAANLSGEVIVPAFTFVATAHALQWQQITPVFCDIDAATHTLDPARVEELITPRTTGIIGVHLWGEPCAVTELQSIADRRGLTLLYDAAHAFGATVGSSSIGHFGKASVLSFHATKVLQSFEGGAIVTDDDEIAHVARLMRNFGFAGVDRVLHVGTNGKMPEVCAAMGLTNLASFERFVERNRENQHLYAEGLRDVHGVTLRRARDTEGDRNHQYVVVEVDDAVLHRDELWRVLVAEGVLARRYFHPGVHEMEPYRSYFPHAGLLLPKTTAVAGRVLVLPTGAAVGAADIDRICQVIRLAVGSPAAVRARLQSLPGVEPEVVAYQASPEV